MRNNSSIFGNTFTIRFHVLILVSVYSELTMSNYFAQHLSIFVVNFNNNKKISTTKNLGYSDWGVVPLPSGVWQRDAAQSPRDKLNTRRCARSKSAQRIQSGSVPGRQTQRAFYREETHHIKSLRAGRPFRAGVITRRCHLLTIWALLPGGRPKASLFYFSFNKRVSAARPSQL